MRVPKTICVRKDLEMRDFAASMPLEEEGYKMILARGRTPAVAVKNLMDFWCSINDWTLFAESIPGAHKELRAVIRDELEIQREAEEEHKQSLTG